MDNPARVPLDWAWKDRCSSWDWNGKATRVLFDPVVSPSPSGTDEEPIDPQHQGTYEPAASKNIRVLLQVSRQIRRLCLDSLQAIPVPTARNSQRLVRFAPTVHSICIRDVRKSELNILQVPHDVDDLPNVPNNVIDCWSDPLGFDVCHLAFLSQPVRLEALWSTITALKHLGVLNRQPFSVSIAMIDLPRRKERASLPLEVVHRDDQVGLYSPVFRYMMEHNKRFVNDLLWREGDIEDLRGQGCPISDPRGSEVVLLR